MQPVTEKHIYQLKLDYDILNWEKIKELILSRYLSLFNIIALRFLDCDVRQTKKGYHVRLTVKTSQLNGNKDYNTAFMQLLLDSDYKREAFNLRRVSNGEKNWNVLFEYKFRNGKQVSEETPQPFLTDELKKTLLGVVKT